MQNIGSLFDGARIRLCAPREEDVDIMTKWHEDAYYLRHIDTDIALPKSRAQIEAEESRNSSSFYFRLRTTMDDVLIGFAVIHGVEWNNRTGLLAIGIGDAAHRNQGYGTEALALILRYAFHELNLHRVGLDVISYNKSAIRAYEKAGFQEEGRLREAVHRDGQHYDRIIMGILRSEWNNQQ